MKRYVNNILLENVKVETAYIGKILGSCFKTKYQASLEHQHNIIYHMKCSTENCLNDYTVESARPKKENDRVHGRRNTITNALKYSIENEHVEVT